MSGDEFYKKYDPEPYRDFEEERGRAEAREEHLVRKHEAMLDDEEFFLVEYYESEKWKTHGPGGRWAEEDFFFVTDEEYSREFAKWKKERETYFRVKDDPGYKNMENAFGRRAYIRARTKY